MLALAVNRNHVLNHPCQKGAPSKAPATQSSAIGAKCAAFHYYGVDDRAWGDCYLHSCAGTIKGPLHDGRDRYAGTCKNTFSNRQGVQFV